MHEMGVAQAILVTAVEIAGERDISSVVVSVGEHQAVSEESLQFSFGLVADGTAAAEAALSVRTVPGDRILIEQVAVVGRDGGVEVLRRTDTEVVEAPHDDHDHEAGRHERVHPAWL